jgi:hypothetical protein
MMDNIHNCDSYIDILSSLTITIIKLLGSQRIRNVFPVMYGQTYRVQLSFK